MQIHVHGISTHLIIKLVSPTVSFSFGSWQNEVEHLKFVSMEIILLFVQQA